MRERGRNKAVHRGPKPKARRTPKSPVPLVEQLARLVRERDEALERLAATSEVLQVISLSTGEIRSVFEAILENAMRICEAKFGHLSLYDGESFHATHLHGVPPSYRKFWERHGADTSKPEYRPWSHCAYTTSGPHRRSQSEPAYIEREPLRVATVDGRRGADISRCPCSRKINFVGAIVIYRQEVRPFTDKQIELVAKLCSAGRDRHRECAAAQ